MQYLLLIYGSESRWDKVSGADRGKSCRSWGSLPKAFTRADTCAAGMSWISRPRRRRYGFAKASG